MKKLLVGLVLLVQACAQPKSCQRDVRAHLEFSLAKCETTCGLKADLEEADCKTLNAVEAGVLRAYAVRVPEFRPAYASCMALAGWRLKTVGRDERRDRLCPAESWHDSRMGCVLGVTHPDLGLIEVFDTDFAFNAFAHEVGHVLDRAYGTLVGNHCGWERRGLKQAIFDVTGELDLTPENCD